MKAKQASASEWNDASDEDIHLRLEGEDFRLGIDLDYDKAQELGMGLIELTNGRV